MINENEEKQYINLKSGLTFSKEEFEAVVEHFATLQKWQWEEDAKLKAEKQNRQRDTIEPVRE